MLFCLDDEPRGGVQAFAVVLSRDPLPSYGEWVKGRTLQWGREAGWKGAWLADEKGVYPIMGEQGALRGQVVEVPVPPLLRLVKALRRRPCQTCRKARTSSVVTVMSLSGSSSPSSTSS